MNKLLQIFRDSLFKKSFIASFDQGLLSIVNLTVSILLIKYAFKIEYGFYSIGFSIVLFMISIQNALVNTPLAVSLVSKNGIDKLRYSIALCYGQYIGILPAVLLGILVLTLLLFLDLPANKVFLGYALSVASVGILLKEFMRAYFFAEGNAYQVLKVDTAYAAIYLGAVGALISFYQINAASVFILMGAAALIAGVRAVKKNKWKYSKKYIRHSFSENWQYGRWSLMGVIVTHIQRYSYLYILGLLLGSTAVADISAARLFMQPLILLEAGWIKVVVPHGSKLRDSNQFGYFFKQLIFVALIVALIIMIYALSLSGLADILERYILSEKYKESLHYIFLWGIIFSIGFIGTNARYGLIVAKRFDIVFKITFVTMFITIGNAVYFIKLEGIEGVFKAMIISQIISASILWYFFNRIYNRTYKTKGASSIEKKIKYKAEKIDLT